MDSDSILVSGERIVVTLSSEPSSASLVQNDSKLSLFSQQTKLFDIDNVMRINDDVLVTPESLTFRILPSTPGQHTMIINDATGQGVIVDYQNIIVATVTTQGVVYQYNAASGTLEHSC